MFETNPNEPLAENESMPGDYDHEAIDAFHNLIDRVRGTPQEEIWQPMFDKYLSLPVGEKFEFLENLSNLIDAVVDPSAYMSMHILEYLDGHHQEIIDYINNNDELKDKFKTEPISQPQLINMPQQDQKHQGGQNILAQMMGQSSQQMVHRDPDCLSPISRSYPLSLMNTDYQSHNFMMVSNNNFLMIISDDAIRFSVFIASHMFTIREFFAEKIILGLKQAIASSPMDTETSVRSVRERAEEDVPQLAARPADSNMYINFGLADNQSLIVAVSVYELSSSESFELKRDVNGFYVGAKEAKQIIDAYKKDIRGTYLCQYSEGTNFYICDKIDIQKQGTNYKLY